ncbi:MAG: hypothetical protein ABW168_08265 [Sedimenticola sp.]
MRLANAHTSAKSSAVTAYNVIKKRLKRKAFPLLDIELRELNTGKPEEQSIEDSSAGLAFLLAIYGYLAGDSTSLQRSEMPACIAATGHLNSSGRLTPVKKERFPDKLAAAMEALGAGDWLVVSDKQGVGVADRTNLKERGILLKEVPNADEVLSLLNGLSGRELAESGEIRIMQQKQGGATSNIRNIMPFVVLGLVFAVAIYDIVFSKDNGLKGKGTLGHLVARYADTELRERLHGLPVHGLITVSVRQRASRPVLSSLKHKAASIELVWRATVHVREARVNGKPIPDIEFSEIVITSNTLSDETNDNIANPLASGLAYRFACLSTFEKSGTDSGFCEKVANEFVNGLSSPHKSTPLAPNESAPVSEPITIPDE